MNHHFQWGNPSCTDWWNNSANGLKGQLEKALPPSFLQEITAMHQGDALKDAGIRELINHSFDAGMSKTRDIPRGYESLNDNNRLY